MIEDFISNSLDSIESIDTTSVEADNFDNEESDFYDSFGEDEGDSLFDFDDDISEESSFSLSLNENMENTPLHHTNNNSSAISFTGLGRCRVCKCGGWAGYGDTCENCGHFFNKHI